jgi:hypothetical protein
LKSAWVVKVILLCFGCFFLGTFALLRAEAVVRSYCTVFGVGSNKYVFSDHFSYLWSSVATKWVGILTGTYNTYVCVRTFSFSVAYDMVMAPWAVHRQPAPIPRTADSVTAAARLNLV